MKKGLIIPLALLFSFFLSAYLCARTKIYEHQADVTGVHATASQLPPEVIRALAGEFKGIVADYLLLEASTVIGAQNKPTPEDWDAITRLFKQSMALDPHFRQTYYLIQATLPWETEQYDLAIELLNISKEHRPWDWVPGFFIGFDYFYFLKDNATASKYLMEASEVPDAPILLATFGARLAQKAGQTQTSIAFLKSMYENTDDEEIKKTIGERINAHIGVLVLEKGIEQFKEKFGRLPNRLEELVTEGILKQLPQNPYGKTYAYEEGQIGF